MTSDPTRGRDFRAAVRVAGVAEGTRDRSSRGSRATVATHPGRPAAAGRGTEAPPREGPGAPRAPLGWRQKGTWLQGQPRAPHAPCSSRATCMARQAPHPHPRGLLVLHRPLPLGASPAPQSLKLPLGPPGKRGPPCGPQHRSRHWPLPGRGAGHGTRARRERGVQRAQDGWAALCRRRRLKKGLREGRESAGGLREESRVSPCLIFPSETRLATCSTRGGSWFRLCPGSHLSQPM